MNIREEIVSRRKERIQAEGHSLGTDVPAARQVPIVPFAAAPHVICEVKRRSPSRGNISIDLNPVEQAGLYSGAGITSISVLTELDYFAGSLRDLIEVKRAYPGVSVLRKDFLIDSEDIDISYRCGADAVLLIASMLDAPVIERMYHQAIDLGLTPLVEVHDKNDIGRVRPFKPKLTGINSRDLSTFRVDLLHPVMLRNSIDWDADLVFESGIHNEEDARVAASSGFSAVLVGEAVVRDPALIPDIVTGVEKGRENPGFWSALYYRKQSGRPLIKICGITRAQDAALATELGADLLGFIFADSPRKVEAGFIRSLGKRKSGQPQRVGVVVSNVNRDAAAEAYGLVKEGYLDVIQFSGDEEPDECYRRIFPYYKALRPRNELELEDISSFHSPRVLIDAFAGAERGGTGNRIPLSITEAAAEVGPVWLAGG
ncbi:MAG: bifunctional indole-3-glycerol phosphate synthase/phosphoribosylanthranilate isomerase, partial [Spirochaetales bacterium]|nr:bifunctional indole-3-glycerol phosphate synthase/phosphoribosylanthranilate isomerase [Spirochaetales bacterium]